MSQDLNKIAKIEQAIKEKYGDEAIQNPKKNWNQERYFDRYNWLCYDFNTRFDGFKGVAFLHASSIYSVFSRRDSSIEPIPLL